MLKTLTLILAIAGLPAAAQMYSDAQLEETRQRSAAIIRDVLRADIIALLPPQQIAASAEVTVSFPARGRGPLAFWSYPSTGEIVMPLDALRFFGDLTLVYAWFDHRLCRVDPVQAYVLHVLLGNTETEPLAAFGLSKEQVVNAYRTDPGTGQPLSADDLSQKIFSSSLYFILAHELGHILLGHTGGLDGALSQAQEWQSDAFALEHFARVGTAPIGILYFYMALWFADPYGEAQAEHSHPMSADRISAIADEILSRIGDFTWREPSPTPVIKAVTEMKTIARIARDDNMRQVAIAQLLHAFPVAGLPQTCP
ncbi:hypothetical protein [Salipiger sp. PrR002]|uniref:hypothetical protein n=1 Tax=Salipiger sp. PrR002 TaxID=2706489 RepID=UPI0013B85149|nr:hypothetical protein [Salipiger sp. PrR002]NDW02021.1 hypothetical protein [Salipiger sp. PrR002]NDW59141.1 hypothetical protein [Salipiger sp. PrR004]